LSYCSLIRRSRFNKRAVVLGHRLVIFSFSGPVILKIDYLTFVSRSRSFYLYRDVIITGEWPQNVGLFLALKDFEHEGILSLLCHTCCDTGPRFFPVSSEGLLHSVAFYNTQGDVVDLHCNLTQIFMVLILEKTVFFKVFPPL
jgi:hypothetical protein